MYHRCCLVALPDREQFFCRNDNHNIMQQANPGDFIGLERPECNIKTGLEGFFMR